MQTTITGNPSRQTVAAEVTILSDNDGLPAFPEGSLSAIGMTLPDNLPFEQWTRCGESLQQMERSIMWWVGDWLNYGEHSYGEMYAQAVGATGYENGTLRDAKWVSSKYELSARIDNLSFKHHRIVCSNRQSEFYPRQIRQASLLPPDRTETE